MSGSKADYHPRAKVAEIDALAGVMDRSRNYIVNQAIEQYLEADAWQVARIKDGIAAVHDGKVKPADTPHLKMDSYYTILTHEI